jgi:hypothetical protein
MMNGYTDVPLWQKPLADKSWNVTNMGDINWDGVNDAGIGTLYMDNRTYFMDGPTGETIKMLAGNDPVDALSSIPDIVGDNTRELVAGGRSGGVACLSGGYDTTIIAVPGAGKPGSVTARLYPNPFTDRVFVEIVTDRKTGVEISVSDIAGRQLFSQDVENVSPGKHLFTLDRSRFTGEAGVFVVNVRTAGGTAHFKVVAAMP